MERKSVRFYMELCAFEFLRAQPALIHTLLLPALAQYNAQPPQAASFMIVCYFLVQAFAATAEGKAPRCRMLKGSAEAEKAVLAVVRIPQLCLLCGRR
jgi:hypothetical protein